MPEMNVTEEAIKDHDGKPPMDLLPLKALAEVARAFGSGLRGGRKPYDWMKGAKWSLYIAAALRHLTDYQNGEDRDRRSNCYHTAHLAATALILLTYQIFGLGTDDRPFRSVAQPDVEEIRGKKSE